VDTLFISDIHLTQERPEKIHLFIEFLQSPAARRAAAVYILGDLFEFFWLGNDDHTPPVTRILQALVDFTRSGTRLYFIRGNRELAMDRGFEALTGCVMLEDMTVIDLNGAKVLITHGDILCTRDVKYQWYRRFMESGVIKKLFLSLPYALRSFLVTGLRPVMRRSADRKPPEIIDVDQAAVEAALVRHNVWEIIHGHTHRPAIHRFTLGGHAASRYVLGDWYQEDSVLVCNNDGKRLLRIREFLAAS
jgi:UDP-2,3-diacylglucosamine hydrolase